MPSSKDAVVLDVDGLEVLRRLRAWTTTPVVILTAVDDEAGGGDERGEHEQHEHADREAALVPPCRLTSGRGHRAR